ncbi:MAG: acetylglutamate kinase, partial [Thermoplasmata archaeon]
NADTVAGEIASALKAKKLIILTDVPGVLANLEDEGSLLKEIRKEEVNKLIEEGVVRDSMIPKLKSCVRALDGGVERAHIIDGRVKHSILLELFTDEGIGTMVR